MRSNHTFLPCWPVVQGVFALLCALHSAFLPVMGNWRGYTVRTVKTASEYLPSPLGPLNFQMEGKCSLFASLMKAVFNAGNLGLRDVRAQGY